MGEKTVPFRSEARKEAEIEEDTEIRILLTI